jgi:hypothetical protein
MLRRGQPQWTGILFRTESIARAGGLDVGTIIDLDLELRMASRCSFVMLESLGAVFFLEAHTGKNLDWREPWSQVIQNLMTGPELTTELRAFARAALEERFRSITFHAGLVAARRGRYRQALHAASLLRQSGGGPGKALFIRAVAGFSRVVPAARPAYRALRLAVRRYRPDPRRDQLLEQLRSEAPALLHHVAR